MRILTFTFVLTLTSITSFADSKNDDCDENSSSLVCDSYTAKNWIGRPERANRKWNSIGFTLSIPAARTDFGKIPGTAPGRGVDLRTSRIMNTDPLWMPFSDVDFFLRPFVQSNKEGENVLNWLRSVELAFGFAKLSAQGGFLDERRPVVINSINWTDTVVTLSGVFPLYLGERVTIRAGPAVYFLEARSGELEQKQIGSYNYDYIFGRESSNYTLPGAAGNVEFRVHRNVSFVVTQQFGKNRLLNYSSTKGGIKFSWGAKPQWRRGR